ncbi:2211_t:CDS:2, partial [Dentiscutata erythropus]
MFLDYINFYIPKIFISSSIYSQDDKFFIYFFAQSNSPRTCNDLNEELEDEQSDSLDYLSLKAEEKVSVSISASVSENKLVSNKSGQKRIPSWTKKFFDTFRLEKKRKYNVLFSS